MLPSPPPPLRPRLGPAWLLAALLCILCLPAWARGDESDLLLNPVSRRDIDRLLNAFEGTPQSQAIESLYAGYRRSVLDQQARFRELKKARAEDPKRAAMEEATRKRDDFAAVYRFVDQVEALSASFFVDVRSIAGPELSGRVDAAERFSRRRAGMRLAVCGPERADLVAIANDLQVTRSRDFDDALSDYERRLDDLMKRKLRRVRTLFEELADAQIRESPPIAEAIGEVLRKLTAGSLEIRDFNVRQARILRDLLPESEQAAWMRAFNARSYPRVHGVDLTADAYAKVRSVEGLSPEQLDAIDRIHERYRSEVTGADARYVAALNRRHDTLAKFNVVAWLDEIEKKPELDDLKAAAEDRNALARACVRRMLDALTSEQRAGMKEPASSEEARAHEDIMPLGDGDDDRGEWSDGQ
ncbi:MAG: hypothetical protein WCK33_02055 [Phycisphaerae bacterium]